MWAANVHEHANHSIRSLFHLVLPFSSEQQIELGTLFQMHNYDLRAVVANFNWDADTYPKLESAYREAEKNFHCDLIELPVCMHCRHVNTLSWMYGRASTQSYCCLLSCLFCCRAHQRLAGMSCLQLLFCCLLLHLHSWPTSSERNQVDCMIRTCN